MKRHFSIFDGLFLLALYFKLSGTGPVITWLEVFLPYLVEGVAAIIGAVAKLFNWPDRLKFWFWKAAMRVRVRRAGEQARAVMAGHVKAAEQARARKTGGNPGQFVDPANKGQ